MADEPQSTLDRRRFLTVLGASGAGAVALSGDTLVVRHDDPALLNARLVGAGVRVAGLTAEHRTLEQVVLGLTGHGTDRVDTRGDGPAATHGTRLDPAGRPSDAEDRP